MSADNAVLLEGDCLESMKVMPDNSVDSIVTDPPYGLSFMGKKWDYNVPSVEIWREALRVLKPGGHLLAFGGTRTYHRLAVNIEDAGFEIRDQIMWLYGSGFPKSMNVGKKTGEAVHAGLGTALKPANEPIVLARKPLDKGLTVAQNVQKYGTGALNIEASRVGTDEPRPLRENTGGKAGEGKGFSGKNGSKAIGDTTQGRWPANIILDEEAARDLDGQVGANVSRFFYIPKVSKKERGISTHPTMKPIELMENLIRMVTPARGVVLDCFLGSGTTGVAAVNLGYSFIGCEMSSEYLAIAERRINNTNKGA